MDFRSYLLEELDHIIHSPMLKVENIPRVDLYMEQLLQFFEQEMDEVLLFEDREEKIFTKTMINNYAKEGALPRPVNKRYGDTHMIMLTYIGLLKRILSISEIKQFFNLVEDKKQLMPLYKTYTEMVDEYRVEYARLTEERLGRIERKLTDKGIEEDKLKAMTFISLMGLEAAVNQCICGKLIEMYTKEQDGQEKEKEKSKKGEDKKEC